MAGLVGIPPNLTIAIETEQLNFGFISHNILFQEPFVRVNKSLEELQHEFHRDSNFWSSTESKAKIATYVTLEDGHLSQILVNR